MRIVFDTNSVVSALLFSQGRLSWLRGFWRNGGHQLLASRATVQELIRVLAYPKFKLNEADVQALLGDYLPFVETVDVSENLQGLPQCRDANDQMFIELASVGNADVLVSGDADLLAMVDMCPFDIESPNEFYKRINASSSV